MPFTGTVLVRSVTVRRYDPTTTTIAGYENFFLGRNVFIGSHALLASDGVPVVIGDDTIIGPGLCLMAGNHVFNIPGKSFHETTVGDNVAITIGRNVWIGARVVILRGVTIEDAAVVGAGSVVTRDLPAFSVAVGNPARVVRWRFEEGADRDIHAAFIDRELSSRTALWRSGRRVYQCGSPETRSDRPSTR